jgi:hypothetical protein
MTLEEFDKLSIEEAKKMSDEERASINEQIREKARKHLGIGEDGPEKGFYFGPLDEEEDDTD